MWGFIPRNYPIFSLGYFRDICDTISVKRGKITEMYTIHDNRRGVVKIYWDKLRERTVQVQPIFTELVDELELDKSFEFYLAYYPYGALIGDAKSFLLPKAEGGSYRLLDSEAPKEIMQHLGYGKDSAPFTMVLEKNLEFYVDLKTKKMTMPRSIHAPGSFFPMTRILSLKNPHHYGISSLQYGMAGTRSTFLLPSVGCAEDHRYLQKQYGVKAPAAKTLYSQGPLFTEIANFAAIDWRCCVVFFPVKFVDKLHNDPRWTKLKLYLYDLGWQGSEYQRNNPSNDIAFSFFQEKYNLKPNPYLADTARHLVAIALGAAPGYAPATNEDFLPLAVLQKAFVEAYGLEKYTPTIMEPRMFHFDRGDSPVYYSFHTPSTLLFSPKSRRTATRMHDIRDFKDLTETYFEAMTEKHGLCVGTIMSEMAESVEFLLMHNEVDSQETIEDVGRLEQLDPRFQFVTPGCERPGARFPKDAAFFRGLIVVKRK
jgi:hypothetical protein